MTATVPAIASKIEKKYTVEAYFELEKNSEERHEFVNGKLFKMPEESVHANIIAGNCDFQLRLSLHKKGYIIVRHDVRTILFEQRIQAGAPARCGFPTDAGIHDAGRDFFFHQAPVAIAHSDFKPCCCTIGYACVSVSRRLSHTCGFCNRSGKQGPGRCHCLVSPETS